MGKLFIQSYGCAMNFSDSEIVASILKKEGYSLTNNYEESDLILLNTCSIREKAEETIRKRLKNFNNIKKRKPSLIIGVLGCMAERLKEKLLNEERKLINSKFYKIPKTELKDLINTAKGSFDFFLDLPKIDKRRTSGKFSEVKTNKDLPKYFLRNFHYQTDGYLSEKSARLYEFQVETLFSGCAATMRRFSMIPLIKFIKDENLPRTKLLDIGTGTGDIIATYKLNTKNLEITCSDLSEEYLNVAKEKLKKFSDIVLCVPSKSTPRIQEIHRIILHTICEFVEEKLN